MPHPLEPQTYKDEFEHAGQLKVQMRPHGHLKLITNSPWCRALEYIQDLPVLKDLLDFIESLLVVDHDQRFTAAEALLHPYLETDEITAAMPLPEMRLDSIDTTPLPGNAPHRLPSPLLTVSWHDLGEITFSFFFFSLLYFLSGACEVRITDRAPHHVLSISDTNCR
jgi:serine/threonine protein kinase